MEQLKIEPVKVKQVEAQSVGSKDAEREADVAFAAVPGSAVDESVLQVKQVEVEFVNAATVPMDSDP